VTRLVAAALPTREGFIAHVGRRSIEAGRALADVPTWAPLVAVQMRKLGVDSVPIALFISVFTGIVLSLLSSYIFTGAVPLYFVGALVGQCSPGWRWQAGLGPALRPSWAP
jgi:ABC-type transporter Mla maintaining outer membrane lipid asymmetry permease subunit MlaE